MLLSSSFRRLCSSSSSAFFLFQGLAQAVEDAVHLLVAVFLDVTPVLVVVVVVAVVNVTLPAGDEVIFLHAPALTPTGALAVVDLFLSLLLGFRAPFLRSLALSMIASWRYWVVFCFRVNAWTRPRRFPQRFLLLHYLYQLPFCRFGLCPQPM